MLRFLLALASEPKGAATRILSDLKVDQKGLRAEVMSTIGAEDSIGSVSRGLRENAEGR